MNKLKLFVLFIFVVLVYGCDDRNLYTISTDNDGYANEYFTIMEDGKFKILEVDAMCSDIEKAGKFYKTHYLFSIRDFITVLDCDCDKFKGTDYVKVSKGDRIKFQITHGEAYTRYTIKYDFTINK